jgi:hypothetical protein
MHRLISLALPALSLALLSACGEVDSTPQPLTEKQVTLLDRELGNKVAGQPVSCISDFNGTDLVRVSDNILLYRVSSNLVYKNTLRSSCRGLARDDDIIVSEQFGSQKCRGDVLKLVDRTSGIPGGFCTLGEFVPYRKNRPAG